MQLKKIAVLSALVSSVALGSVGSVLADNTTPVPTSVAARQAERLPEIQARVDRNIGRRINTVNRLLTRLQKDSKIAASDKTLLQNEDQAALTSLNSLKAKVDADTTVTDVLTDEKTLPGLHINDFLVPQNNRLVAVNNVQALAAKLGTVLTTIQTHLTTAQSQGTDVSAMQTLLNDANAKLQTINGQLTLDERQLATLTPTSSNPAATFSQVRTDLGTIRTNFSGIRGDLSQIRSDAQALKKTATPVPTPTP